VSAEKFPGREQRKKDKKIAKMVENITIKPLPKWERGGGRTEKKTEKYNKQTEK